MEERCENCKNIRICKFYEESRKQLRELYGSPYQMSKKTWNLWASELPNICLNFGPKTEYDIRDKNGVLIGHIPLKIWYPDQKPDEEKLRDQLFAMTYRICSPTCQCRHCQNARR